MSFLTHYARTTLAMTGLAVAIAACNREPEPDAYGSFEATEIVVSSQTAGQVQLFVPQEGMVLPQDSVVAFIDTTQLGLERSQLIALRGAAGARGSEVAEQLRVLEVQRDIAQRAYERTQRLRAQQAATAQQLDQAEREYRVVTTQIAALRAAQKGVGMDEASAAARVQQIGDRITKSTVLNPRAGTVLAVYTRQGEVVQAGQPLYRIANLDTLELRAYITAGQLAQVQLGQIVQVHITAGDQLATVRGVITWIAAKAEFTPTPVQTRDERADLVYAVKIQVPNTDGALKIGMPADVTFGATPARD